MRPLRTTVAPPKECRQARHPRHIEPNRQSRTPSLTMIHPSYESLYVGLPTRAFGMWEYAKCISRLRNSSCSARKARKPLTSPLVLFLLWRDGISYKQKKTPHHQFTRLH